MDNTFWIKKWQVNEIGFHLPDVHPLLQKYYSGIFSPRKPVFVPLCGKTKDLSFFQLAGNDVLGVDLSEIAAKDFFSEHYADIQVIANETVSNSFVSYQQNNIEILVGDIFNLTPRQLDGFRHIYDRAALIALPKAIRGKYISLLKRLMPRANMLLITLDYQQGKIDGPPFSVNTDEVNELFWFARVELLHANNIIEYEPKFKSRGLEYFNQKAYWVQW